MRVIAPRRTLILAAAGLIVLGVVVQYALGYRFGGSAGQATEALALLFYAIAIVLIVAPLGRARALMSGGLAFILTAWAVHLNTKFSTTLHEDFAGGVAALSQQKLLLATLFLGPLLGLIVAVATILLARSGRVAWTPKTPAS